MAAVCLTCTEIEQKICDLADELSALTGCGGVKITEDGTTFDYGPTVQAKIAVMNTYKDLYETRCAGMTDLYEFVHVPCVKPARCTGSTCTAASRMRQNRRRYR